MRCTYQGDCDCYHGSDIYEAGKEFKKDNQYWYVATYLNFLPSWNFNLQIYTKSLLAIRYATQNYSVNEKYVKAPQALLSIHVILFLCFLT